MKNLASILVGCLVAGAACALLSCSGSGKNMTGTGGGPGTAGDGGGVAGTSGAAGVSGVSGGAGTGGGAATVGDPCRGTALPTAQHYVPSGMCARTVATGQGALRQLVFSSNGDLWGVNGSGQIKRFRDANGDGVYQSGEIVNWATTGGNGQNVHIDEAGGYLYSGTNAGVRRWMWSNTIDSGGAGQDVLTGQPSGGHGKHTVHVWDNWMYVMSGSSGNVTSSSTSTYDTNRNIIKRFNMTNFSTAFTWSSGGEIFVDGIRNVLGFNRDAMGRMYGVQNGQDDVTYGGMDVHNDNPGEVIIRLEAGSHHGYPLCMVAQRINNIAPGTQVRSEIFPGNQRDDAWCQTATNAARPVTFVQAHSAPMDITFFLPGLPAGALPERWRNGAFVSLHGSWNRSPATGFKVVWVPFNADGTSPLPTNSGNTTTFPYEVVLSGGNASASQDGMWGVSGGESNVRPVGVAVSPVDGALYISSDTDGYVYRVGLQR
jgi:glucose/arabinose dehydrogenase